MRILRCEPEEIKNPYQPCDVMWGVFEKCKQVVLDQAPDVDLDVMVEKWCGIKGINSFTQFLKEQLKRKKPHAG